MIPIFSKISLDTSELSKGLTRAQKRLGAFKSSVVGIGSAIAGSFAVGKLRQWVDELDRISKLSTRLGTSAELLQRLNYAAELNGTSLEVVTNAMTSLTRRASDFENTAIVKAFDQLNISQKEFAALKPDKQMTMLADAVKNATDRGAAFRSLQTLLEEQFRELIPLFEQGGEAIRRTMDQAGVATDEQVDAAVRLKDEFTRLENSLMPFMGALVKILADVTAGWVGLVEILKNPAIYNQKKLLGIVDPRAAAAVEAARAAANAARSGRGQFSGVNNEVGRGSADAFGRIYGRNTINIGGRIRYLFSLIEQIGRPSGPLAAALANGVAAGGKNLVPKSTANLAPTVSMGDSLARVGGGGNVATSKNPAVRALEEQNKKMAQELELLRSIRDNTGKSTLLQGGN